MIPPRPPYVNVEEDSSGWVMEIKVKSWNHELRRHHATLKLGGKGGRSNRDTCVGLCAGSALRCLFILISIYGQKMLLSSTHRFGCLDRDCLSSVLFITTMDYIFGGSSENVFRVVTAWMWRTRPASARSDYMHASVVSCQRRRKSYTTMAMWIVNFFIFRDWSIGQTRKIKS